MSPTRRLIRLTLTNPVAIVSFGVVVLAFAVAALAPYLGLNDPHQMAAQPYLPPGGEHWLGTDNYGRDVFSRVVWGTRVALLVAVGSAALSILIGVILGSIAGYYGGWIDGILSRAFDVFLLIPAFFLVLLIVALFGSSLVLIMVAIALTTWPRSARIMRSQVLSLKSRTFVQAALASGATGGQTIVRHIVPNGIAPIITDGTILMGLAVLTEAGLSFLGLGDQNEISWGRMIFEGQRQLRLAPWMSIAPGVAMLVLVASLNLLGDGLTRALNPQLQSRGGAPRRRRTTRPPTGESNGTDTDTPILEVIDLRLAYDAGGTRVRAVDGVSFTLRRGHSLGIVGESGCGKSSLGSAILQTVPNNAHYLGGTVRYDGKALLLDGRIVADGRGHRIRRLRWRHISTIFQSSMNALNPVVRIRKQLVAAYRLHRPKATKEEALERVREVFDLIGIPRSRIDAFPHQLSGGMRQRAMIALSLILEPDLVIADEPTTALDMLIQDQILGEIDRLRNRLNLTLILVSHDMGAVAETCEEVAVMYAGRIVEKGPTDRIFEAPAHPYTRALIEALPSLSGPKRPLATLPGETFRPVGDVVGCRFAPRCRFATDICRRDAPPLVTLSAVHLSECHHAEAVMGGEKRAYA